MKLTEPQPELLPCPFCGSDAACYSWQDEDLWSHNFVEWQKVRCTGCECEGQSSCEGYEESETAVAVWNTRAPQWQPIETAPKDGTPILACYAPHYETNGFLPVAVRWRAYHPNARGNEEWRDSSGAKVRAITHWQPLPAAPEVEG